MVKFQQAPVEQSSALLSLLPAEVRTIVWEYVFADSKICYKDESYDQSSSIDHSQIARTCRFAYLDTFGVR